MTLKNTRSGYRSALSKVYTDVSQQCDENTLLNELLHAREIHQKIVALQKEIIDNEKEQKGRNIEESWLVEHTQYFSLLENLILDKLRELSQPPEEDQDDLPQDQSKSTDKKTIPGAHCSTSSGTSSSEFASIIALVERLSAQHADTTKQQNELIKTLVSGRSTKHKPFKLPPLQIPKFDGTYKSWTSFRDLFIAAVHENDDLSPGQKHQQLMGYLMPEASSCIRHIQISDANYEKAWSLLKQRYEKPYNIVADHIQTFLSIPHVKSVDKKTLRYAHSTAVEVTNALDAMHVTSRDPWLIHMLNERLDPETRKLWEDKRKDQSPTWDDYLQFLGKRCDVIEACGDDPPSTSTPIKKSSPPVKKKTTTLIATQSSKCTCCNKDGHPLYRCSMFLQKTPSERLEVVKKAKLCRNCINSSHLTNDCDRSPCRQCGIRHNSLLHDAFAAQHKPSATITSNNSVPQTQTNPQPGSIVSQSPASDSRVNPPQPVTQSTSVGTPFSINYSSASSSTKVFLSTCVVNVMDSRRIVHQCRAVLDSGAQQSMMTDNLRERLQLRCSPDSTVLVGFNNRSSRVKGRSELLVLSSTLDNSFEFNCLVVPQVTGKLPNFQVDPHAVQIPSQITLSDPNWCVESPIDLLIGMDHYNDVVLDGVIRQGPGQPVLRQTVFGWVLSGAFKDASTPPREVQCNVATLSSIEKVVKRFWEVEEVECASSPSAEDAEVEEHFRATVSRDDSGRFIVHLPLRPNHSELGNSKKRATRQLLSLENRLEKLPHMRQLYDESMNNYLAKGYMTEIPRMQSDDSNHFYLPHHGVWKPSSTSTKLRVVFNASAKSSSGLSLNDVMRIGPTVQPDLITVLMRFRLHPYAMRCDISQMYLQVKLHQPHADFQRILYRKTTSEPIREYKINRVCFGVASSPYLATRVLNELAETEQGEFPLGSQAVLENFYVDDGLISCPSLESALTTQSQLIELMAQGGFSLAKWCATHPRLLENVDESSQDPRQLQTSDDSLVEVLGIKYDPQQDSFHFLVGPDFAPLIGTRRVVSSVVARLYDPLGLIGPVITEGKILIQRSWSDKTSGWDTELPPEDQLRWKRFVETLPQLNTLQFPRWVSDIFDPTSTVIHGFADASQEAYGAAVYIVTTGTDYSISSHLLISKSRIAPKGELTIPKLELCAAELCARLVSRVQNDLRIPRAHFWSDSTIVLAWIRSPSEKRGVFVNNHIKKILQATQSNQWRHVSSPDNPADLISRGCTPGDLGKSSLWFHGPAWLSLDPSNYPSTSPVSVSLPQEEEQTISVNISTNAPASLLSGLLERISRLSRLQGTIAQVIRALTPAVRRPHGPLSPLEMGKALIVLIKLDQRDHFPDLIDALVRNEPRDSKPIKRFANLQPFLDAQGLVRVGGRLNLSNLNYDAKHPILLPSSKLAKLIAQREHIRQMHCGHENLLACLRQRFWPLKGRSLTRGIARECVQCFKVQPRLQSQLMGQLPANRITLDRPFASTSVDFAGPLQLRPTQRKGAIIKVYVSIFVCHATKAIHIEMVSNLSTEAFIAAFRRFVARRSAPAHLFADNATNFTGSKNELERLLQQEANQRSIQERLVSQGVQFHFQPPDGPHHNGLVEAAVKSVKTHLHRVVGSCPLTYEEMQTILVQIEAVLNSRPLTRISTDASDSEVLTPGHFLVGGPLNHLPDPNLQAIPMNRLSRWQLCQRLYQDFSARWKREYVHLLQERKRWKHPLRNVRVGDLALLSRDHEASLHWPLGQVVKTYPGPDGYVRVVDIRTTTGIYRRPISRLALLPTPQEPTREDVGATSSF